MTSLDESLFNLSNKYAQYQAHVRYIHSFETVNTTVLEGQLRLMSVKIIFILSDTSSLLWIQTNRRVTCGTSLQKKFI
jgi:hypothetical protein